VRSKEAIPFVRPWIRTSARSKGSVPASDSVTTEIVMPAIMNAIVAVPEHAWVYSHQSAFKMCEAVSRCVDVEQKDESWSSMLGCFTRPT
jgi:hypothetical protein